MNYRHAYHAGNFSDVLKHVVLIEIIKRLQQKDKPFFYLDTHAGRGMYDLNGVHALKTHEADNGIRRLMKLADIPSCLQDYINTVKATQQSLDDYPGSPMIVRQLMRVDDRMVLTELHPQEYELLKELFCRDRQVVVQLQDAYQGLRALLPPTPRRGLILIDPAFEVIDEFELLVEGVKEALKRFATGVYAIWYPLKDKAYVQQFLRKMKNTELPLINVTIKPFADGVTEGLNETGVLIVNPPWQLDLSLREIIPILWKILSPEREGGYKVESFN